MNRQTLENQLKRYEEMLRKSQRHLDEHLEYHQTILDSIDEVRTLLTNEETNV